MACNQGLPFHFPELRRNVAMIPGQLAARMCWFDVPNTCVLQCDVIADCVCGCVDTLKQKTECGGITRALPVNNDGKMFSEEYIKETYRIENRCLSALKY
jgi:hypothetical protein